MQRRLIKKKLLYTGRSEMYIDGRLPNGTIPGLGGNVFVKVEGMVT